MPSRSILTGSAAPGCFAFFSSAPAPLFFASAPTERGSGSNGGRPPARPRLRDRGGPPGGQGGEGAGAPPAGLQRDQVRPCAAREAEVEADVVVDRIEGAHRDEVEKAPV